MVAIVGVSFDVLNIKSRMLEQAECPLNISTTLVSSLLESPLSDDVKSSMGKSHFGPLHWLIFTII